MPNNSSAVSVIVPVYNTEKYLRRCLDSILTQTFTDWECLVIDDGSTDTSPTICDEYANKDPRFKVFHKMNSGASASRNVGIDNARGEYIIFIDSDDWWQRNDCLKELATIAETNGADLVRGEYQKVDEEGNVIIAGKHKPDLEGKILSSYEMLNYGIAGEFFGVLFLFRRKAIGNNRYDESMTFLEDMDFLVRIFRKSLKCIYAPLCFYSYLKRDSSTSNVANVNNVICSFSMCDKFTVYAESLSGEMEHYYLHYGRMMYYWTMNTVSENPYYALRKEIIRKCELRLLRKRLLQITTLSDDWHYWILLLHPNLAALAFRTKNNLYLLRRKILG